MAPEVISKQVHDGRPADVFQIGVMLFIIVVGSFPFQNAQMDDDFYKMLCNKESQQQYWKKITKKQLTKNFKDLIQQMLHNDPKQRIFLQNIKEHQWCQEGMKKGKRPKSSQKSSSKSIEPETASDAGSNEK